MSQPAIVGVDLAKEVIVVCAVDAAGRELYVRQFSRKGFAEWAALLPACTMAMEACGSAHDWGRRLTAMGHTARLIAPDFVKPFNKSKGAKNDRNDARAIVSAVRQPDMRFVAPKSVDQQALLAWHRMRDGWIGERTALLNRLRGLLAEFGVWLGRSRRAITAALAPLAAATSELPERVRPLVAAAAEQLRQLNERIERCDLEIRQHARQAEAAQRLAQIQGIGPVTSSALVASISDARNFRNGRQLAAWLGLVPRQNSSGGVQRLGAITRRGDRYLRRLLVEGAQSALAVASRKAPERCSQLERWMLELRARAGWHRTVIALANKNARMAWALLARGENYCPQPYGRHNRPAGQAA